MNKKTYKIENGELVEITKGWRIREKYTVPKLWRNRERDEIINVAKEMVGHDCIDVADDAEIEDNGEDGYWVNCRLFVSYRELREE